VRYQQEKYEIFEANVQEFKEWLQAHDEQFEKHSCFASCDESCKIGIDLMANFLGRKFLQRNENITLSELKLPYPGHHARIVDAENGIDLYSQNTTLHEEPKSEDEELTDESENLEIPSLLADWVLDLMCGFRNDYFDEKIIIEYKIEFRNDQEKNNGFYKASRCASISEYIEEYKVEFTSNTEHIKKRIYKKEKTEFGNECKTRKKISLFCKLAHIETILRDIYSLKPAALKDYLKEFKFENISPNWKKQQLLRKLSELLNNEREALLKKTNQANVKEKMSSSNKSKIKNVGDDMYITKDGDYVCLADETGQFNILFDIDEIITKFVCNNKTYILSNVCGRTAELVYRLECSGGLEMMYIFSYTKIGEGNVPNVGDVVVVGGKPNVYVYVQITGNWHQRKNIPIEQLHFKKMSCWTREARKRNYESKV
jgi:hypothetical protein